MKSHTDLEQSKKLAEFLPLESADMYYSKTKILNSDETDYIVKVGTPIVITDVPCWSLAALLKVISNIFKYNLDYNGISFILTVGDFEVSNTTAVDACFKMILKLKENSLL